MEPATQPRRTISLGGFLLTMTGVAAGLALTAHLLRRADAAATIGAHALFVVWSLAWLVVVASRPGRPRTIATAALAVSWAPFVLRPRWLITGLNAGWNALHGAASPGDLSPWLGFQSIGFALAPIWLGLVTAALVAWCIPAGPVAGPSLESQPPAG